MRRKYLTLNGYETFVSKMRGLRIEAREYPVPERRPLNSVLSNARLSSQVELGPVNT